MIEKFYDELMENLRAGQIVEARKVLTRVSLQPAEDRARATDMIAMRIAQLQGGHSKKEVAPATVHNHHVHIHLPDGHELHMLADCLICKPVSRAEEDDVLFRIHPDGKMDITTKGEVELKTKTS